jgi:hypothetical protein
MTWKDMIEQTRIRVDAATRARHLEAVEQALAHQRKRRTRPGRALAVAVALVLLLPVVAFAAERSQPGDLFYPVRQVLERVGVAADLEPYLDANVIDGEPEGLSRPVDATLPPRDVVPATDTTATTAVGRTETSTTLSRTEPTTTRPIRSPTTTTVPERPPSTRGGG